MPLSMKKAILTTALLATTLFGSSCQGPNQLFTAVNEWNADLTEKDWVNTGVFWGFHIIPVYPFAYTIDVLVTNTVEYWKNRD